MFLFALCSLAARITTAVQYTKLSSSLFGSNMAVLDQAIEGAVQAKARSIHGPDIGADSLGESAHEDGSDEDDL